MASETVGGTLGRLRAGPQCRLGEPYAAMSHQRLILQLICPEPGPRSWRQCGSRCGWPPIGWQHRHDRSPTPMLGRFLFLSRIRMGQLGRVSAGPRRDRPQPRWPWRADSAAKASSTSLIPCPAGGRLFVGQARPLAWWDLALAPPRPSETGRCTLCAAGGLQPFPTSGLWRRRFGLLGLPHRGPISCGPAGRRAKRPVRPLPGREEEHQSWWCSAKLRMQVLSPPSLAVAHRLHQHAPIPSVFPAIPF